MNKYSQEQQQQLLKSGVAMRQEMKAAGFTVPQGSQPYDVIEHYYRQFSSSKEGGKKALFDSDQKQLESQLKSEQQGKALRQISGLDDPALEPIMKMLLESGGVKPSNARQYNVGTQLQEPNTPPLDSEYDDILTGQGMTPKDASAGSPTAERDYDDAARAKGLQPGTSPFYAYKQKLREKAAEGRAFGSDQGKSASDENSPAAFGKRYIDPDDLSLLPQNMTVKELRQKGAVEYDEKIGQKIADMDAAGLLVQDIGDLATNIITAKDTTGAYTQKLRLEKESIQRTGPAKVYKDTKKAFLGKLQKAFGGEVGVLTNQDIDRVDAALPQFSDTAAIKDYKMGLFQQFVDISTQAQKDILTGKILTRDAKSQYRPKMLELIKAMDNPKTAPKAEAAPSPYSGMSDEDLLKELSK